MYYYLLFLYEAVYKDKFQKSKNRINFLHHYFATFYKHLIITYAHIT